MHLGESSQCPSTQVPIDVDCDFGLEYMDDKDLVSFAPAAARGGVHARGGSDTARSSSAPSQSQPAHHYKVQGPN